MKARTSKSTTALTMIEVLMVVAVLMLLAAVFLPLAVDNHRHGHSPQIRCVNNLKQVNLSFIVWAADNNDKFPMQVSVTNSGTMEYVGGPETFRHFQVLSNELSTPKILFCPAEDDPSRRQANLFAWVVPGTHAMTSFSGNQNASYFVGVDAIQTNAATSQMFLVGDRNLTNGTPIANSLLSLGTNPPAGWTAGIHFQRGNIGLVDGSVQQLTTRNLPLALENSGVATNRLAMP